MIFRLFWMIIFFYHFKIPISKDSHFTATSTVLSIFAVSYIKIYPKRLCALRHSGDSINAKVFYDVEQYGCIYQNQFFDATISPIDKYYSILVDKEHPEIKNFSAFLKALNFYVFNTLQLQITPEQHSADQDNIELDLGEVYFSLETDQNTGKLAYTWCRQERLIGE